MEEKVRAVCHNHDEEMGAKVIFQEERGGKQGYLGREEGSFSIRRKRKFSFWRGKRKMGLRDEMFWTGEVPLKGGGKGAGGAFVHHDRGRQNSNGGGGKSVLRKEEPGAANNL